MIRLSLVTVFSLGLLFSSISLFGGSASVLAAPPERVAIPESNPYEDSTQCTYRAWELAAQAGHRLPAFGNAADWRQGAIAAGYEVSDTLTPACVDSVAVWGPGVGGASAYGHVGWVTQVRGDQFLVEDRNWIPATDDTRWVTWQPGMSFITFSHPEPVANAAASAATSDGAGGAPQAQPAPAERSRSPQAPAAPAPNATPASAGRMLQVQPAPTASASNPGDSLGAALPGQPFGLGAYLTPGAQAANLLAVQAWLLSQAS